MSRTAMPTFSSLIGMNFTLPSRVDSFSAVR
jgi:hypothetical protein